VSILSKKNQAEDNKSQNEMQQPSKEPTGPVKGQEVAAEAPAKKTKEAAESAEKKGDLLEESPSQLNQDQLAASDESEAPLPKDRFEAKITKLINDHVASHDGLQPTEVHAPQVEVVKWMDHNKDSLQWDPQYGTHKLMGLKIIVTPPGTKLQVK
jgi:hypothetical protein